MPALLIAAVGMTFVLMVGAIDLSIGSVLALASGMLGVGLLQAGLPLPVAMLAAIGTAVGVGLLNAAVILRWRLPSFIVTLGMLEMARGGAYLVTSSQTQYLGARVETIAHTALAGVPLPFLLAVLMVIAGQAVLSRSPSSAGTSSPSAPMRKPCAWRAWTRAGSCSGCSPWRGSAPAWRPSSMRAVWRRQTRMPA